MKIVYIAETSITNKSAYTHHVMKMCDAFSKKCEELTLIIPNFEKKVNYKKLRKIYLLNSKKKFQIKPLLNFKTKNFILRFIFGFQASKFLKEKKVDLIITRSFISSFFLTLFKINHFLEIHSELKSITKLILINLKFIDSKYIIKIILISKSLNKIYNINKKKLLILHDGVDLDNFKKYKKIKNIKNVSYVGSFYKGRGIEIIYELAKKFSKIKFKLYGSSKKKLNLKSKNIRIYGHVDYQKVPEILSRSDVLLMPYANVVHIRAKNINTANYCSPLKMFDYLASGKVIMSSKLDGICEVLKHNFNSIIVKKYNEKMWIDSFNSLIQNKYNLNKLQTNALLTAKKYTWNNRVKSILLANKKANKI